MPFYLGSFWLKGMKNHLLKRGWKILRGALGELDASPDSLSNCPSIPTSARLPANPPAHPPIHSFTHPPIRSPFIPSGLSVFASSALCSHLCRPHSPFHTSSPPRLLCPHRSVLSCYQFVVALISPLLFLLLTVLLP